MSTDNVLAALDEVRQVPVGEGSEEEFHAAAEHFLLVFHEDLEERGRDPWPLEDWDPRPELLVFELELQDDRSLDPSYLAAAKRIHDSLDAAGEEMARLN